MRRKGYIGRTLAGMMAAVLMLTSVPFTVYAAETGTSAETVSEQEENLREEEPAQEDEEKDKSEEESKENGDDLESDEEQIGEGNGEADQEADEEDDEKSDNGEAEENLDADDTEEEPDDQDITEETVSGNSVKDVGNVLQTDLQSSFSVKGRNSVGNMLAEALSDKAEEALESNGYNVFSVEMDGQMAEVSFETLKDAVLTVAIYDESGKRLITSASCEVSTGDQMTEVEFTETVPEYFYVRSFLTDTETLQPLCSLYDSPMYTEEMQKFMKMTTDDFDEDRVLNLDDDKTNNFAVYNEDAIVIPEKDGINILVSADEENYIYVIENADESITSLEPGDLFIYEYTDDDLLIVKIATIEVDGTTATITGEKLSMEEVFDYIKIDTEAGLQDAEIDVSGLDEGIIYEGLVSYSDGDVETYAFDGEAKGSVAASYKLNKELSDKVKLSGNLDFSMDTSVKVYLSFKYQYLEVKFNYSVKLQGSISAEDTLRIVLSIFRIHPLPAIYIEFTPSFIVEAKGKATWSGTLKGTIGEAVSSDEGVKNLTSLPDFKSEFKTEITIFLGISLAPEIGVVSEKIAAASMDAMVGVEVKGSLSYKEPSTSKIHGCASCIDGDIAAKIKIDCKAKIFNSDKMTVKTGIEKTVIIADFYYSLDFDEFGWGKCPRYLYKIEVTVTDKNGTGVKDAKITVPEGFYVLEKVEDDQAGYNLVLKSDIVTGDNGMTVGYLASGEYTFEVTKEKYGSIKKKIQVTDKEKAFRMKFKTDGENTEGDVGEKLEIKSVGLALGYEYSMAITIDGNLYMWGRNTFGVLGDGTTEYRYRPVKVLADVCQVDAATGWWGFHSGAITQNGDLYVWGRNRHGVLGDGTTNDSHTPIKVMDDVVSVSLGCDYSGAITKDGDLYMWGSNGNGELGDRTEIDKNIPQKIMSNVLFVDLGNSHSGAITTDGSLYMWGSNISGQLGDGGKKNINTPKKIMDDVATISLGGHHSGAVTVDGILYMWGECGLVGDGTTDYRLIPTKILDNVACVSLGSAHSGAVKTDGSLYMWGYNESGELGDGTTEKKLVPTKISLLQQILTTTNSDEVQCGSIFSEEAQLDTAISFFRYAPCQFHTVYSCTKCL